MSTAAEQTESKTFHATLDGTDLKFAIKQCQQALQSHHTHIEISASKGDLRCRASCGTMGLEAWVQAEVDTPQSFAVDPSVLLEALEVCPDRIKIEGDESFLRIQSIDHEPSLDGSDPSWVVPGFSVRIPLVHPNEAHTWPDSKSMPDFVPDVDDWTLLFSKVLTHASKDAARVNLNGIYFEHDGETGTFAATDGHRMAVCRAQFAFSKLPKGIVVPAEFGKIVCPPFTGQWSIAIDDDYLFFKGLTRSGWTKLNKVTFPPYRSVIPDAFLDADRPRVTVNADAFAEAAGSFAAIYRTGNPMILKVQDGKLQMKNNYRVDDPEGEHAIPCEGSLEYEGEIGIAATYIRDALKMLDNATIQIYWDDHFSPLVLADPDGDNLVICMPMRY